MTRREGYIRARARLFLRDGCVRGVCNVIFRGGERRAVFYEVVAGDYVMGFFYLVWVFFFFLLRCGLCGIIWFG